MASFAKPWWRLSYDTAFQGCCCLVLFRMGWCWGDGELSPSFSVVLNDKVSGCCAWPCVERHVVGADRASFPDWAPRLAGPVAQLVRAHA